LKIIFLMAKCVMLRRLNNIKITVTTSVKCVDKLTCQEITWQYFSESMFSRRRGVATAGPSATKGSGFWDWWISPVSRTLRFIHLNYTQGS
jgi:hypothetical protein